MNPLDTLHKVVDLAQQRRDEAVSNQARLQRELQMATEQMQQLMTYADEAQTRWSQRCSGAGVDAALLQHHRQFMHKIDHATEFQRGVISQREALFERAQQQVFAAERDLAGLRKYTEKKQQALDQRAQRQEQKATDEMALAIHLRQSLARTQGARP
jgi:flagellar FliJ protein